MTEQLEGPLGRLKESEEIFRTLVASIPGAVYRASATGERMYSSLTEFVLSLTGHPAGEFLEGRRRWGEIVHPDDRARFERELAAAVDRKEPYAITYRIVHADGGIRHVLDRGTPLRQDGGDPTHCAGVVLDDTEGERLTQERDQQIQTLKAVLEQMGDGCIVCDSQGRFTQYNSEAERLTGIGMEQIDPKDWTERYGTTTPDGVTPFPAADLPLARALRGESADAVELRIRNPQIPEGLVLSVTARPLRDPTGKLTGGVAVFRDVTEIRLARERLEKAVLERTEALRKSQEQLLQSQKMEAIGRLAGGISHDFNNLLMVIMGYAEFLIGATPAGDPARADLQEIHKAGTRAAGLTRQLLAFSRRQVIEPKIINLNDLVLGMDKLLRRVIGEDVELVTLNAPNLDLVKVDPGQFEQVLMNLAVNARDAMPGGGKLTLETANVVLDAEYAATHPDVKPGPYVAVTVSDTGHGMTPEVRARLFEPFFTTKERGKGTGLGLATCFGIVKQCGGDIWVYSEPGRGTAFKVYFPRAEGVGQSLPGRDEGAAPPVGTETVLVVEDESGVRALSVRVLRGAGYTVMEAAGGEEALKAAEGKAVHLLVTDVVMPLMGGREVATRLAAAHPRVKILYTSGYTDDAIVHHGVLEAGLNFLQKPYGPAVLLRKVREVLDA